MWGGRNKGYWKQFFGEALEDIRESRLYSLFAWKIRLLLSALEPRIRRFDHKSLVFVLALVYEMRDL
jgi:hypothetical protein